MYKNKIEISFNLYYFTKRTKLILNKNVSKKKKLFISNFQRIYKNTILFNSNFSICLTNQIIIR